MPASQQPLYYYKLIVQQSEDESNKEYFGTQLHTECGRASSSPPRHFIPLGDSKQLSRCHFTLSYLHGHWYCVIKGKNAVMIAGRHHRREQLPSGEEGPEIKMRLADDRVTPLRIGDVRMWFCPARKDSATTAGGGG